ncbi:alpha/beta hydrolase [Sphingomonas radiodurans]|uniref:alpha/beta hydrolase n=1 Tax=Sphingomonas radiodurans TaxID=2890321 RepID=UPI001E338558|nr:alpha/beta hydrolase [Sphingomonas radiodurans]WBH15869.1 alpha/beta hydrolase [Sphingomonas radiodurans]
MSRWLKLSAAALLAGWGIAATPAPSPETIYKAFGAKASKPFATISYGADPLQVADLRIPSGRGPFPVAIVIHGGCWRNDYDTRAGIAGVADALGKRGFATWNIEYRRIGDPGGGWPGTFQDVAAAEDKLAEIAERYKLVLSRVILVGHSAGAHLAMWAASRSRLPAPWNAVKVRPVAVAAIDGPAALAPFVGIDAQVCGQPVIASLMGGLPADKPAAYALASPAEHLPLGLRQLLVIGEFRPFMQPYVAGAKAAGDPVAELAPPNANHFDIVTPSTANGAAVIDFIAREAIPGKR